MFIQKRCGCVDCCVIISHYFNDIVIIFSINDLFEKIIMGGK